jgi:hypothetical protein
MKLNKTLKETSDYILWRIGGTQSTQLQTDVLTMLNDGLLWVVTAHNWTFMREKTTLTIAGSETKLPEDCARVLVLHLPGSDMFPIEVDPLTYEREVQSASLDEPSIYVRTNYDVGPSGTGRYGVRFWSEPSTGAVFDFWYIKYPQRLLLTDEDDVPPVPPHVWDLAARKAELDAAVHIGMSSTEIKLRESRLAFFLDMYQKEETFGGPKHKNFDMSPGIMNYLTGKGSQR